MKACLYPIVDCLGRQLLQGQIYTSMGINSDPLYKYGFYPIFPCQCATSMPINIFALLNCILQQGIQVYAAWDSLRFPARRQAVQQDGQGIAGIIKARIA